MKKPKLSDVKRRVRETENDYPWSRRVVIAHVLEFAKILPFPEKKIK